MAEPHHPATSPSSEETLPMLSDRKRWNLQLKKYLQFFPPVVQGNPQTKLAGICIFMCLCIAVFLLSIKKKKFHHQLCLVQVRLILALCSVYITLRKCGRNENVILTFGLLFVVTSHDESSSSISTASTMDDNYVPPLPPR